MRKRFEPQRQIGQLLIEDTPTPRSRDGLAHLVIALRELYRNVSCRNQILDILEEKILKGKRVTGRPGMEFACFIYFVNPHTGIKGGITVVSIDMNPRWGYACNKYLLFSGGCMNFLGTTELFIFCY